MKLNFLKTVSVAIMMIGTVSACDKKTATTKNCPPVTTAASASEVTQLEQYLASANISATKDDRGFYYTVNNAGSGNKPSACATVTVNYKGRLTTGEEFDAADGVEFPLPNLIVGWQEGIPLIAPGGKITLYLPPSLAYGSAAQSGIPANSILIFEIDLVGVE